MTLTRDQVERDLAQMEANGVPAHIADALRSYALDGLKPGSFTCACIDNDFTDAVCMATPDVTVEHMRAVAKTLYNDFPSAAWGSRTNREAWAARGGAGGR